VGRSRYFYTLTFTYDFRFDEDFVFFAYCQPYTYSALMEELNAFEKDPVKSQYVGRNTLCRTIAGNKCDYITITAKNQQQDNNQRRGVFISARVHPGEANSSWMMKGIMEFLLSGAPEAHVLREKFVFKIVPMLNPVS
jgi:murein tripeptide amidase MpaA